MRYNESGATQLTLSVYGNGLLAFVIRGVCDFHTPPHDTETDYARWWLFMRHRNHDSSEVHSLHAATKCTDTDFVNSIHTWQQYIYVTSASVRHTDTLDRIL